MGAFLEGEEENAEGGSGRQRPARQRPRGARPKLVMVAAAAVVAPRVLEAYRAVREQKDAGQARQ